MTRGITAILGWVFAVITPQADRLTVHLEDSKETVLDEERDATPALANDV